MAKRVEFRLRRFSLDSGVNAVERGRIVIKVLQNLDISQDMGQMNSDPMVKAVPIAFLQS